jgi:class 3 adenylate cyclase/tetratricopeptide (TPR) repeat protein
VTICSSCGAENPVENRFCGDCGSPLTVFCASCGASNPPAKSFCGQCGAALDVEAARPAGDGGRVAVEPVAERRLVSVLFADLVGFTTTSEDRDAEATRELLSRYFELARTLIGRYGGTVEKFIGDAVMAVWGTPTATEDDAERAVRAALDLVASVPELDPALQARAGVLTGEAAVTIGAEGEGMVAGDLVNTASRLQSAAEPRTVLVGESTKRATEQAIAYEEAGVHGLKGKAAPVSLFRALRVVSGVRGQLKSAGLEAPFVGRDRELKLIKDLFHGCADDRRAHLLSVTGIAGVGKSRLAWEFYKYFDGIVDVVWWHRGRCLAYGEGVAYWALADMVRMRCRIAEDERPELAREKLRATLAEHVLDDDERGFVEPRLAHLLGFEERSSADRQELFAAWRLFFERLADTNPTVLAFEDMQWADASLLDFVEYLLEWSRDYPLYVITLARPELRERRPGWGAGQRNFTSLYLEPLSEQAMEALLDGLVPGLPERLSRQILARAEGVPLYAVETVRMLLDRGLLAQEGSAYRVMGEVETLDVPETLHALIAARLDGVSPEERRLLQDGAVLGKTFTAGALAAVSGVPDDRLEPLLSSLVRKEVLGVQSDPRSPEHGQYGFLQDLVRHVAYETLARTERKSRHLAAAEHLQAAFAEEDEIAEVIAAHYLAAHDATPDARDARAIRDRALDMLARAGERAASLGASGEAHRAFEQAAELASEPEREARLRERAGTAAYLADRHEQAASQLERSLALFQEAGRTHAAARVSARLAEVESQSGELRPAIERMEAAFAVLSREEPDADFAALAAQLARLHNLQGESALALERVELALSIAEALLLPEVLAQALNTKASVYQRAGRLIEAETLLRRALEIALEHDLHRAALRAYWNLHVLLFSLDRVGDAQNMVEEGLGLARRAGDRHWDSLFVRAAVDNRLELGEWEEAIPAAERLAADTGETPDLWQLGITATLARVYAHRGDVEAGRAHFSRLEPIAASDNPQQRAHRLEAHAALLAAEGRLSEALEAAEEVITARATIGLSDVVVKVGLADGLEAALQLGRIGDAERLLGIVDAARPGELTPLLKAHGARYSARIEALRGGGGPVESGFETAAAIYREVGTLYPLAATLAEHAEWLVEQGRAGEAEPLASEAREIFERLGAKPWLERLAARHRAEPEAAARGS